MKRKKKLNSVRLILGKETHKVSIINIFYKLEINIVYVYRPYIQAALKQHLFSCNVPSAEDGIQDSDYTYVEHSDCTFIHSVSTHANISTSAERHQRSADNTIASETTTITSSLIEVATNAVKFDLYDQAPRIFAHFRSMWGINIDLYTERLLNAESLTDMMNSAGRSGSFFYISRCQQFIIKTLWDIDAVALMLILKDYHVYQQKHKDTLLPRFFGLHYVKVNNVTFRFVVMQNICYSPLPKVCTFDLKGSTNNRSLSEAEKNNPNVRIFSHLSLFCALTKRCLHWYGYQQ